VTWTDDDHVQLRGQALRLDGVCACNARETWRENKQGLILHFRKRAGPGETRKQKVVKAIGFKAALLKLRCGRSGIAAPKAIKERDFLRFSTIITILVPRTSCYGNACGSSHWVASNRCRFGAGGIPQRSCDLAN
jgi:hypothetical protein